jgi:hypothetical protein
LKVLICGDRNYSNRDKIRKFLESLDTGDIVIQGYCRGADMIAHEEATNLQMISISVPAQWNLYAKSAGPVRNQKMLDLFRPHFVAAFHDDFDNSRGTRDMVKRAKNAGIEVGINPTSIEGYSEWTGNVSSN